jgi:hypothetical protein
MLAARTPGPIDSGSIVGRIKHYWSLSVRLGRNGTCKRGKHDSQSRRKYHDFVVGETGLLRCSKRWTTTALERVWLDLKESGVGLFVFVWLVVTGNKLLLLILLEVSPKNKDPFSLYTSRHFLKSADILQTLHGIASFCNHNIHFQTISNLCKGLSGEKDLEYADSIPQCVVQSHQWRNQ